MKHFIIIGGGVAGVTAAQTLRQEGFDGEITLISGEARLLYSRVFLPYYIEGKISEDKIFLRNKEFYQENSINLVFGTITQVDLEKKEVLLTNGQSFSYDKLLIATGGNVKKLAGDAFYFKTIDDTQKIKESLPNIKKAAVIGGGFIATEFLNILSSAGIETHYFLKGKYPFSKSLDQELGEKILAIIKGKGIYVYPNMKHEVGSRKNEREFDFVGVGIGLDCHVDFLSKEIKQNHGMTVNKFLQSSDSNIYAAGDVAEFEDIFVGHHHQLGTWSNAVEQGIIAAKNMLGQNIVYKTASIYAINLLGTRLIFIGETQNPPHSLSLSPSGRGQGEGRQIIRRSDNRIFVKNNYIIGAILINNPIEVAPLAHLIKSQSDISKALADLSNSDFDLNNLIE